LLGQGFLAQALKLAVHPHPAPNKLRER
jgi:hypothetical protein